MKNIIVLLLCPVILFGQKKSPEKNENYLRIAIAMSDAKDIDTLKFRLYSFYPTEELIPANLIFATLGKDSLFRFKIPINTAYGYFAIGKRTFSSILEGGGDTDYDNLIENLYWEKGDDITIRMTRPAPTKNKPSHNRDYTSAVVGKGALKYDLQLRANKISNWIDTEQTFDKDFRYHDIYAIYTAKILRLLDSNKTHLTVSAYNVLKADYAFGNAEGKFSSFISEYYRGHVKKEGRDIKEKFLKSLNDQKYTIMHPVLIPDLYLSRSREYALFILNAMASWYNIEHDTYYDPRGSMDSNTYFGLKRDFKGVLRDKMITYYLSEVRSPENIDRIIKDALLTVKTPYYYNRIRSLNDTRGAGRMVYDFSFPDPSGKFHSLKDFRGKTIFVDVWFTGCGGCSGFYQSTLSDIEKLYENDKRIVFISISMDTKKTDWEKGLGTGMYTNASSVNLYTNGNGYLDPFITYYKINGGPTVMLIDKEGRMIRFNSPDLYERQTLIENINRTL